MEPDANPWDTYAIEYGRFIARREQTNLERDPILSAMLAQLGDLRGLNVLDACCGEGFLSRVLARQGARVTGVDLSPRLIEMAGQKDADGVIDYRVGDLSRPMPELVGRFDRVASHLALNDIRDYKGFAATVASLARAGARIVAAFNNPYSSVVRGHITDYFASGTLGAYGGMAEQGVMASYYHRTLEEYLDAFLATGLRLTKLVDVPDRSQLDWRLPTVSRFPRFMVLAFDKA
jgi:2-polyprenyl-3-methyl-5-hydroxy-6-metoxy-1,4-benzoquinol methylase